MKRKRAWSFERPRAVQTVSTQRIQIISRRHSTKRDVVSFVVSISLVFGNNGIIILLVLIFSWSVLVVIVSIVLEVLAVSGAAKNADKEWPS